MSRWIWLPGVIGIGRGEGVRKPDTRYVTRLTRKGRMVGFVVKYRGRWYGGLLAEKGYRD